MVKYYKGKCYFGEKVHRQTIKARTACVILRYKVKDKFTVLTIRESPKKMILEFPGGKVEPTDINIRDTLLRESWEEIVLKDDFHKASLQNWRSVHDGIKKGKDADSKFFTWLEKQLVKCPTTTYGNCPLRTVYYIVDISKIQATYLMETHGMIPFSVNFMSSTVTHNRTTKSKEKRFTRRTTYFHINGEEYRLRGRDFEGMFKYVSLLEKPVERILDWSRCRSPKLPPSTLVPAVVQ